MVSDTTVHFGLPGPDPKLPFDLPGTGPPPPGLPGPLPGGLDPITPRWPCMPLPPGLVCGTFRVLAWCAAPGRVCSWFPALGGPPNEGLIVELPLDFTTELVPGLSGSPLPDLWPSMVGPCFAELP